MVKKRDYDNIGAKVTVLYDRMFPLYIVQGEKNFLIDAGTGVHAPEVRERIDRALEAAAPDGNRKIDTLLLTHSHWDHTSGAFYLQQEYGFDVIASQHTVDLLQRQKVVDIINRMNRGYKEMVKSNCEVGFDYLRDLQVVREGNRIEIDSGSYFEVFETPGHTKCSIVFFMQPERILFTGDALGLIDAKGGIRPLFFSSYTDYEDSIKKIAGLEAEVLALPHNKFIKGKERIKKHLEDALVQAQEVKDVILKFLETEMDRAKVTAALYEQEFSDMTFIGSPETLMENIKVMVKIISRLLPPGGPTF